VDTNLKAQSVISLRGRIVLKWEKKLNKNKQYRQCYDYEIFIKLLLTNSKTPRTSSAMILLIAYIKGKSTFMLNEAMKTKRDLIEALDG
jgi:hypothetical protein